MGSVLSRQSVKRSHREAGAALTAFAVAMFLFGTAAIAQRNNPPPPPPRPVVPSMDPFNMPPVIYGDPTRTKQDEKRLAYLNAERHKTLVAATNRLVKLAGELQAQINSEPQTPLTPDQVRQFQEIEKLAHNIRDKMSTSVRPAPSFDSGPPFPTR
jgi:hypothetical protein